MHNLLLKAFVKDYQNTADPQVREAYGKLAGTVGIVSNTIVSVFKIAVGMIFSSISILADGLNNLADASSSLITLIGFRMASKPADEDHPYGHARIEYITGLIVSFLIIMLGVETLKSSAAKIMEPEPLQFSMIAVGVLVASIVVKLWQASFNMKMGEAIDSATLKATGADSRNDVISTTAVLISLLIGKFTGLQLDGYMGVLVALFILWSGICLIKETSDPLLGLAPDPTLVKQLEERVLAYEGILGIHDLVVHDYGPGRVFASVHAEVDANGNVMESHDLIDNIEKEVGAALKMELVIHMDPVDTKDPLTQIVKQQLQEVVANIEDIVNVHDVRVVPGYTHHNILFDIVVGACAKQSDSELKELLSEKMKEYDVKYRCVIEVDRNYAGECHK
ncbi:MAG: cation transporter [Firmicutes bacterium]|nr:cation transporter [Bacillota bacterium]